MAKVELRGLKGISFVTDKLSREDLASIAANATVLWERVGGDSGAGAAPPKKVGARLREWSKVAAEGNETAFARRLAFDGLSVDEARRLLATMPAPSDLPVWAPVLNEVLRKLANIRALITAPDPSTRFPFLNADAPIPFEELIIPFVAVACDRIVKASGGGYSRLAGAARANLERGLTKKLSELAARVLLVEFRTYLACGQFSGWANVEAAGATDDRGNYRRFVEQTVGSGWAGVFREYPVLAHLMTSALLNWVDATAEFLWRFERDGPDIRRRFFADRDAAELADVQSGLSDSHHGGRAVIALTFRSGARLVYKPKNVSLDVAYGRFVDWLNEHGAPIAGRCPIVLDRGDYGWMEFIENLPCETEDAAERFYRRSGALLCLVYVLNGIDFHFENVIACREHPIPVDLETIYHHVAAPLTDDNDPIAARLRESVLRADILPNPVKLHDRYYDISAIARSPEKLAMVEHLTWKNVNTDRMSYATGAVPLAAADNMPKLDGRVLDPMAHVGDMAQGFRQMYRYLLVQRERLLQADSPLRPMFRCPARFLFRATAFYQSILNKALNPDYLRHGADFGIQLDVLSRKPLKAGAKPATWPLVRDEAEALLRGDVPKFAVRGDDTSLTLKSGATLRHCFPSSAWESLERKIRGLSEDDLAWQVRLIGAAMDAHAMRRAADLPAASKTTEPQQDSPAAELTTAELLQCAVGLARDIAASAIYDDGGEPSWLVLNYVPEADQFALEAINLDLYNGRCGLALFFAALERCAPALGYRELSYATLAPVRRWLARAGSKEVERMGLGGLIGFPSLIYALTRIRTFLGDDELLAEACRATTLLHPKQINADKRLDVMGGAAGAILCLLACHAAADGADSLDKAIVCGRHLLARREPDKCGARTWATFADRHLTGFSHGASGIAYALLRLFEKTAVPEFLTAAKEAIDFENSEFVADRNNWPDRRPGAGPVADPARLQFKVAWCSGAPGIGLARLAGLHILDSPGVRRDIDAALTTTSRHRLLQRDHLCCGNIGLAETLLKAGTTLSKPDWISEAVRLASRVAKRAERKGRFAVTSPSGFFNPTLFQGAAGVGYEILRLAFPDKITSVLMLE